MKIKCLENKDNSSKKLIIKADWFCRLFCIVIIAGVSASFLLRAVTSIYYHEIDSYVLPTVSMQYRHSIIMSSQDLEMAKIDYPDYYVGINDFDSLRSSKLAKINDDSWASFYFPIYSMLCLPLKMLMQLFGADQIRAFTLMNAVFLIISLIYTYRKLNVSYCFKMFAVLLFILSPIYMYVQYISSEAMIFSAVMIGMVMYSNRQYKRSAFMIALASMPNPTVMGIGIVMFAEYFVKTIINIKKNRSSLKSSIIEFVKYGCCYIPALIPFAFNALVMGTSNPTASGATLDNYFSRVFTYLFDVNIGFFSFAPITLCAFFVLIVVSLVKRKYGYVIYAALLLLPVMSYSLMVYITCIPVFCARYVMWTYPVVIIGTVIIADDLINSSFVKSIFGGVLAVSSCCMLLVNSIPMYYFGFNGVSTFLLENFPSLYNPNRAMFYADNDKLNWPYDIDFPSYYFSQKDGSLRKLLFKSTDEYKDQVIDSLTGSEKSLSDFSEKLKSIPSDGKFHYVNISPLSDIDVRKKTSEEKGLFFRQDKVIQYDDTPFAVDTDGITIDGEIKKDTYYKIDVVFHDKVPFNIFINENMYQLSDFDHVGERSYSCVFWNAEASNLISVASYDHVVIESLNITEMKSNNTKTISEKPISFSGGNVEDVILYPIQLAPMKNYVISVDIADREQMSDEDVIVCQFYYEKRFNHVLEEKPITRDNDKIMLNSGDTTIGIGPVYLEIKGKSKNKLTIRSVTVECI